MKHWLTTVKRICSAAGISGYKTNQSVKVIKVTRLFQPEVLEEQFIMKCTVHRALREAKYIREFVLFREQLCSTLNLSNCSNCNTTIQKNDFKKYCVH